MKSEKKQSACFFWTLFLFFCKGIAIRFTQKKPFSECAFREVWDRSIFLLPIGRSGRVVPLKELLRENPTLYLGREPLGAGVESARLRCCAGDLTRYGERPAERVIIYHAKVDWDTDCISGRRDRGCFRCPLCRDERRSLAAAASADRLQPSAPCGRVTDQVSLLPSRGSCFPNRLDSSRLHLHDLSPIVKTADPGDGEAADLLEQQRADSMGSVATASRFRPIYTRDAPGRRIPMHRVSRGGSADVANPARGAIQNGMVYHMPRAEPRIARLFYMPLLRGEKKPSAIS